MLKTANVNVLLLEYLIMVEMQFIGNSDISEADNRCEILYSTHKEPFSESKHEAEQKKR